MKTRKNLTKEQKEYIVKNYPYEQTGFIAEKLGITPKQVSGYAWNRGIKKDKNFIVVRSDSKFTYEEVDYIYENFADTTNDVLAKALNCETKDIAAFARTHKLTKSSNIYKDFRGMPVESKKFIIENYRTMRTSEIAKIIHMDEERIRSYAYLHGVRKDTKSVVPMCKNQNGLTTEQKEYIIENYSNQTNKDIAEKLGITVEQVHGYASDRKLEKNILFRRTKPHYFEECQEKHKKNGYELNAFLGHEREPKVPCEMLYKSKYGKWTNNPNYFEIIDNEWKAYWLGFLYADGYVRLETDSEKKKYTLSVALATADESHLEKFRDSVQADNRIIRNTSHLNGKEYYNSRIVVTNKKLCEDLVRLGCTPRKSLTLTFPDESQVPKKYRRDFIRGYFDGDGCICVNEEKRMARVNIIGTEEFLTEVQNCFVNEAGVTKTCIIRTKSKAYELQYGNIRSVELIYKYLYRDSNIFLDRKLQKFNKVFSLA